MALFTSRNRQPPKPSPEEITVLASAVMTQQVMDNTTFAQKPGNAKKKKRSLLSLVVIFLLLLVGVLVGIMYWSTRKDTIVKNSVEQSKKLSAEYQKNDYSDYSDTISRKNTTLVQECYGITIPFTVRKVSRTQPCSVLVSLESEHGTIAVSYREHLGSVESPDVGLRRANPATYIESKATGRDGYDFVVFKNTETRGYEKSAFLQKGTFTISISLNMDLSSDYEDEFQKMLSSFYCIDGCRL